MIVYLTDLITDLDVKQFAKILLRASLISVSVFIMFAALGEIIFLKIFQSHFASFQIFGGIIFLLIGLNFVFKGNSAIRGLRGKPNFIAGSIAMPIMIGPGTISGSIMAGKLLNIQFAALAIFTAVATSTSIIIILKKAHDVVKARNEDLIARYIEIMGRITALFMGTFAIELIMQGLKAWVHLPKILQ